MTISETKSNSFNGKFQLLKETFTDLLKDKFTETWKETISNLPFVRESNKKILQEEEQFVHLQVGKSLWENAERQLRTELWLSSLQRKGVMVLADRYDEYLSNEPTPEAIIDIDKDVPRTFPNIYKFSSEEGQNSLRRVLRAYASYDPDVAYCQGMNFVTGLLLMYLPSESHVFAALVLLMEERGLRKFYSHSMSLLQVQLWQLGRLMPQKLNSHLESCGVVPVLFGASWLMTCFSADFPTSFSARILDVLMTESMEFPLLKVASTILVHSEQRLLSMTNLEEILTYLKLDVPAWDEHSLHDVLSSAFSKPWTQRQLAILHSTDGAESVSAAMDRVADLTEALSLSTAGGSYADEDERPANRADDSVPGSGSSDGASFAPTGVFTSEFSERTEGTGSLESSGTFRRNLASLVVEQDGVPVLQPPPAPVTSIGVVPPLSPRGNGSSLLTSALASTGSALQTQELRSSLGQVPAGFIPPSHALSEDGSTLTAKLATAEKEAEKGDLEWDPFTGEASAHCALDSHRLMRRSLHHSNSIESRAQPALMHLRHLQNPVGSTSFPGNAAAPEAPAWTTTSTEPQPPTSLQPSRSFARSVPGGYCSANEQSDPFDFASPPAVQSHNPAPSPPRSPHSMPMSAEVSYNNSAASSNHGSPYQSAALGQTSAQQAAQGVHVNSSTRDISQRMMREASLRDGISCCNSPRVSSEYLTGGILPAGNSPSGSASAMDRAGNLLASTESAAVASGQLQSASVSAEMEQMGHEDALRANIGVDILRAITATMAASSGPSQHPVVFSNADPREFQPVPASQRTTMNGTAAAQPDPKYEDSKHVLEIQPINEIEAHVSDTAAPLSPIIELPSPTLDPRSSVLEDRIKSGDFSDGPDLVLRKPVLYVDGIEMWDPKQLLMQDKEVVPMLPMLGSNMEQSVESKTSDQPLEDVGLAADVSLAIGTADENSTSLSVDAVPEAVAVSETLATPVMNILESEDGLMLRRESSFQDLAALQRQPLGLSQEDPEPSLEVPEGAQYSTPTALAPMAAAGPEPVLELLSPSEFPCSSPCEAITNNFASVTNIQTDVLRCASSNTELPAVSLGSAFSASPPMQVPAFVPASEDLISLITPIVPVSSARTLLPELSSAADAPGGVSTGLPDPFLPLLSLSMVPAITVPSGVNGSAPHAIVTGLTVTDASVALAGVQARNHITAAVAGQSIQLLLPQYTSSMPSSINITMNISLVITSYPGTITSASTSGVSQYTGPLPTAATTPVLSPHLTSLASVPLMSSSDPGRSLHPLVGTLASISNGGLSTTVSVSPLSQSPYTQPALLSTFAHTPLPSSLMASLPEMDGLVQQPFPPVGDSPVGSAPSPLRVSTQLDSNSLPIMAYSQLTGPNRSSGSDFEAAPIPTPPIFLSPRTARVSSGGGPNSPPAFANSTGISRMPSNELDAAMLEQIEGFHSTVVMPSCPPSCSPSCNTSLNGPMIASMGGFRLSSIWQSATAEDYAAVGLAPPVTATTRASSAGGMLEDGGSGAMELDGLDDVVKAALK